MDLKGFATYLISKISEASTAWENNLFLGANKGADEVQKAIGVCSALRSFINDIPIHLYAFTKLQDDANNNVFSTPDDVPTLVSDADVTVLPPIDAAPVASSGGEAS